MSIGLQVQQCLRQNVDGGVSRNIGNRPTLRTCSLDEKRSSTVLEMLCFQANYIVKEKLWTQTVRTYTNFVTKSTVLRYYFIYF